MRVFSSSVDSPVTHTFSDDVSLTSFADDTLVLIVRGQWQKAVHRTENGSVGSVWRWYLPKC